MFSAVYVRGTIPTEPCSKKMKPMEKNQDSRSARTPACSRHCCTHIFFTLYVHCTVQYRYVAPRRVPYSYNVNCNSNLMLFDRRGYEIFNHSSNGKYKTAIIITLWLFEIQSHRHTNKNHSSDCQAFCALLGFLNRALVLDAKQKSTCLIPWTLKPSLNVTPEVR